MPGSIIHPCKLPLIKNYAEPILNKKIITYFFSAILKLLLVPLFSQQSITISAEKSNILLGEPLTVSIAIIGGQEYHAAIPDTLGRFEVLEKLPETASSSNGNVTTTRQIIVTSFDSGALRIPPIAVAENPSVVSAGLDIIVNTLPADATTNYGDLKQIIDLESPSQLPYILVFLLLLLFSVIMLYQLNKKYKKQEATITMDPDPVQPYSLLQQIEQLRADWIQEQTTPLQLGNQLMDILKKFLGRKGVNSTSKTGEELVMATQNIYDPESWQRVVQTIRLCNAMRFGKYQASKEEGIEAIDAYKTAISVPAYQPGFSHPVLEQSATIK